MTNASILSEKRNLLVWPLCFVSELISTSGPSHAPQFIIRASLNDMSFEGSGKSKKDAKLNASKALLVHLHKVSQLRFFISSGFLWSIINFFSQRRWSHKSLLQLPFLWRLKLYIIVEVWWLKSKQNVIENQQTLLTFHLR